jgi:DNA-binding CsgD family transcriptional regulator
VHAEQALAIAEQLRAPFQICSALKYATVAALLMGDAGGALSTGRRLLEYAAGQHASAHVDDARFCLGLTELSRGDPVRAAEWYRQVSPSSWRLWNHIAGARPHVDAIEALAHTGDLETARDLSATLPPDARERVLAQAILAGSAGDPDSAVEVLRSLPANEVPFRRAREALLLGRYLRQGRRRRAAREAFLDARTTFEAIASSLWVDRVDAELARVGGRQRVADRLTETERQVAERAAAGRTNKEIASDLGIAVRTAEAHLSSVYVKLGLQSRVELAARWHAVLAPERAYGTAAGRSTIVDLRNGRARRLAIASPPLGSRDRQDDEAAGRG